MKYFSTFSGIGGFELGIQRGYENLSRHQVSEEGAERERVEGERYSLHSSFSDEPSCVGYSEIDKYAIQIYRSHFPDHRNYGDITAINTDELPDFDFLVGGFPCQSFSIAGKRGGFEDTRGTMFFELARILRAKQPRLFLFENVKGLLSHDNGNTFRTIISTIDELGYDCQWQVLNSKNHGVPQNRERVFIVGHLRGTPRPEVFPFGETGGEDTQPNFRDEESSIRQERDKPDSTNSIRRSSLTTGIRRLTPTECERLQGFPDGWTAGVSDTQRYKTLGNAVTVNVIEAIMTKLIS